MRFGRDDQVPAPPIDGMLSVDQLCRELGIKERALRLWVTAGILESTRRGRYLYFDEHAQLRARAGAVVVKTSRRLSDAARALAGLDEAAFRKIAGLPETQAVPNPELDAAAAPEPTSEPERGWRTVPLVPGLELRVREDAPPIVQRLADAIARGEWLA